MVFKKINVFHCPQSKRTKRRKSPMQIKLKRPWLQKSKFVECIWPGHSSSWCDTQCRLSKTLTALALLWYLFFFPSLPWKKGSVSVVYCLVFENETVYFVTGIDCLIHFGDPSTAVCNVISGICFHHRAHYWLAFKAMLVSDEEPLLYW